MNPRWIMGISDRCSYSPWVVAKHCFVIFLIECWAALGVPMKVESVRETLVIFLGWICLCQGSSMHEISISGDFSGVDFVSVSDVISACDFNDKNFH